MVSYLVTSMIKWLNLLLLVPIRDMAERPGIYFQPWPHVPIEFGGFLSQKPLNAFQTPSTPDFSEAIPNIYLVLLNRTIGLRPCPCLDCPPATCQMMWKGHNHTRRNFYYYDMSNAYVVQGLLGNNNMYFLTGLSDCDGLESLLSCVVLAFSQQLLLFLLFTVPFQAKPNGKNPPSEMENPNFSKSGD